MSLGRVGKRFSPEARAAARWIKSKRKKAGKRRQKKANLMSVLKKSA